MDSCVAGTEAPVPPEPKLEAIEHLAVELANLAGAEILTALGGMHAVRYKTGSAEGDTWRDPVSEIDERVEGLIRARLAQKFPEHNIIGEEIDARPGRAHDYVWAVDPIDGTANFVNGFPLFAASIGVMRCGVPIAGAVWCSTSHTLRAGVYHARLTGWLCFNGERLEPKINPTVRRALAGVPSAIAAKTPWESRKTGSAAIECAFAAAGLLRVARFERPNLWDVAGGIPLVLAAGGDVRARRKEGWVELGAFEPRARRNNPIPDLRYWSEPLIVGDRDAVGMMSSLHKD